MDRRGNGTCVPSFGTGRGAPDDARPASTSGRRWVKTTLALALLLAGITPALASDRDAYRAALIDFLSAVRELQTLGDAAALAPTPSGQQAVQVIAELPDARIDAVARSLPEARLRDVSRQVFESVAQARSAAALKTIVRAPENVQPALCTDFPPAVAYAALGSKVAAGLILASLEDSCLQTEGGVNLAAACVGAEVFATAAEIASEQAEICKDQMTTATAKAVLDTERSAGQHFNEHLDVPQSTRATQVSVTAAAGSVDLARTRMIDIREQLGADQTQIASRLSDLRTRLDTLSADISDIQSHTDDIAFRMQVAQADVEDIQDRSAQAHQQAGELTTHLDASRNLTASLAQHSNALLPAIDASSRQQRRDDVAAALGDGEARVSGFALPAVAGGRLEEAREVLIGAITALQQLGQGNTTQALALLADGDTQYNLGNYPQAWQRFSAAYRALDSHVAAGAP